MYKPTVRPNGIEGDDLPFHLDKLGVDMGSLRPGLFFWPLVDHYNTHNEIWFERYLDQAVHSDTVIFYDLLHMGDLEFYNYQKFIKDFSHPRKVWLTTNQKDFNILSDGIEVIQYDFMWNRFKSYYTEHIPEDLYLHHYAGPGKYTLPVLDFEKPRSKKFMCLTGREWGYRTNLYELIQEYKNEGYISNRTKGIFLEHEPIVGIFNPVPNQFYEDSFVSIYVESNWRTQKLIHVTEKTFDPLVKGHAILPLANPGIIPYLERLGFQLPPFIDYSFDQETDLDHRFKLVMDQFYYLMKQDLFKLFQQCKDIFEHNRRCLQDINYDQRILRLNDL